MPPSPVSRLPLPSTWFTWHDFLIKAGDRVLDLACGEGRHSIPAANRGARVVGLDKDDATLEVGRDFARAEGLAIDFRAVDLEATWPELGVFDAVLVFNYLDRVRMPRMLECVAPGGVLIMETFFTVQRTFGWGPRDDDHLLLPGEINRLVAPLDIVHGREVVEPVDTDRWRAVAGIVAERRK
ncbi:MAG: class I SAM-dependent methyltransferase [Gemmatimonadota bacterium]